MVVLKSPVVTEKTIKDYKDNNKVTFEVTLKANKITASKAVEKNYGVTVVGSWVKNRLGKKGLSRTTRKVIKKSPDKKIMSFQLKEGDKVSIFEG